MFDFKRENCQESVSYTHLDVYKRQALRERGELTEQQERDIRKDLWEGMEQSYLQMKENSADYLLPATAQDADETPIRCV